MSNALSTLLVTNLNAAPATGAATPLQAAGTGAPNAATPNTFSNLVNGGTNQAALTPGAVAGAPLDITAADQLATNPQLLNALAKNGFSEVIANSGALQYDAEGLLPPTLPNAGKGQQQLLQQGAGLNLPQASANAQNLQALTTPQIGNAQAAQNLQALNVNTPAVQQAIAQNPELQDILTRVPAQVNANGIASGVATLTSQPHATSLQQAASLANSTTGQTQAQANGTAPEVNTLASIAQRSVDGQGEKATLETLSKGTNDIIRQTGATANDLRQVAANQQQTDVTLRQNVAATNATTASAQLALDGHLIEQPSSIASLYQTHGSSHSSLATANQTYNAHGTQHAPAQEQVAVKVSQAIAQGLNRVSVQLDPASLGRVEIQIEMPQDGKASVLVLAERQDTLDMLRTDSKSLEKALQDAGIKADAGALEFGLQQGNGQQFASAQGGAATGGSALSGENVADGSDDGGATTRHYVSNQALDISV